VRWQSHWKFVSDEGAHKSMLMLSDVQVAVRLQLLFKFRSCFRFSYEIVLLFSDYAFGIVGHGPAPFSLCLRLPCMLVKGSVVVRVGRRCQQCYLSPAVESCLHYKSPLSRCTSQLGPEEEVSTTPP
jgi:hypothetical protein